MTDVLNEKHGICLVRETETGRQYVEKILTVYSIDVYRLLRDNPVPNIPAIHDMEERDGVLYIAEEYVYGQNLKDLLETSGPLPAQQAGSIMKKLCQILTRLHSFDPPIIHRDIKPSNIIIAPDDSVWLIDLNASKIENSFESRDTVLIGTEGYAAPEQYGFGPSNTKTDIYAAGVLFNEMLTGALPSQAPAEEPARGIIEKCTKLDPSERYSSAEDILLILDNAFPGTAKDAEQKRPYHKWLPPGFRSLRVWFVIPASLGYIFLLAVGLTLGVQNVSGAKLWFNRFSFIFIILALVFFLSNYGDIWRLLGLKKIKMLWLRIILIIVAAALLFGILMMIFTIINTAI